MILIIKKTFTARRESFTASGKSEFRMREWVDEKTRFLEEFSCYQYVDSSKKGASGENDP